MKKHIYIMMSLLVFSILAGCSDEPRDFTYYQAGEYKGAKDPLVAKNLHEELNKRLMEVQTDR